MREFLYRLTGKILFIGAYPVFFILPQSRPRMRVIISDQDGNIVAVKNWIGRHIWLLPGGGAHGGETDEEAAVREVMEEVGITLSPDELSLLGDVTVARPLRPFRLRVFHAKIDHIPLTPHRPEIVAAEWLPFDVLPDDFAQFKETISIP